MDNIKFTIGDKEIEGIVPMKYKGKNPESDILEARSQLQQRRLIPDTLVLSKGTLEALLDSMVPFNPRFERMKTPAPGEVFAIFDLKVAFLPSLKFGKCHVTLNSNIKWGPEYFALIDSAKAITLQLDMAEPNPLGISALPRTYFCEEYNSIVRLREDGFWVIWHDNQWTTFEEFERDITTPSRMDRLFGTSQPKTKDMVEQVERFRSILEAAFKFDKAQPK